MAATATAAAALVLAALLAVAGCAKKQAAGPAGAGGAAPPARAEDVSLSTLALMRGSFEQHKAQWRAVLSGADSPLPMDQVDAFPGPEFYPYDASWRFVGDLDRSAAPRTLAMPDTKGREEPYIEYGLFRFERAGRVDTLVVYRPIEHPQQFFIPFRDSTSGHETYEGGRYVHLDSLAASRFLLDFNHAYNPYCAYASTWACPLPPRRNELAAAVRAGMKFTPVP